MDKTAEEVLALIERGQYVTERDGGKFFAVQQEDAERGTKLYTPEHGLQLLKTKPVYFECQDDDCTRGKRIPFYLLISFENPEGKTVYKCPYCRGQTKVITSSKECEIFVTEETTQVAAHRLLVKERIDNLTLLNFASGKNPGGGFLKGSKAQEEDLCRCSGLYPCLAKQMDYYKFNRSKGSPLYSDYTIYSPRVPCFRKDSREYPNDLFFASVITSPAPNTGEYLKRKKNGRTEAEEILKQRAGIILAIAQNNNQHNLLLGAWGCGVFRNDPAVVAKVFSDWLKSDRFNNAFDRVTFAVYCPGKDKSTFNRFKERFK